MRTAPLRCGRTAQFEARDDEGLHSGSIRRLCPGHTAAVPWRFGFAEPIRWNPAFGLSLAERLLKHERLCPGLTNSREDHEGSEGSPPCFAAFASRTR